MTSYSQGVLALWMGGQQGDGRWILAVRFCSGAGGTKCPGLCEAGVLVWSGLRLVFYMVSEGRHLLLQQKAVINWSELSMQLEVTWVCALLCPCVCLCFSSCIPVLPIDFWTGADACHL